MKLTVVNLIWVLGVRQETGPPYNAVVTDCREKIFRKSSRTMWEEIKQGSIKIKMRKIEELKLPQHEKSTCM